MVPPPRPAGPDAPAGGPAADGSTGTAGVFGRRRKQAEAEAQLRSQIEALTSELEAVKRELAEETSSRSQAEVSLGQAQARTVDLESQLSRAQGMDITERAAEVQRLSNQIAQLRREREMMLRRQEEDVKQAAAALADQEAQAKHQLEAQLTHLANSTKEAEQHLAQAQEQVLRIRRQIVVTEELAMLQEVGVYAYRHPLEDAVAYKSRLEDLRDKIKVQARNGEAVHSATNWTVNNSQAEGKKMVRDFSKLMLRAYNAEADYAVRSMKPHRLASLVDRLDKSRATIARLGQTMQIRISDSYHRLRVQELELMADYLAKQEEEKERRRELRERQREEEKLQREIERERARLAKEQAHYRGALERLRVSTIGDAADQAQVEQLEQQLAELDAAMTAVDAREANIRAGYVYVISNIGAFGENVIKIGLTRRLEPMDRVNELGDASVPFRFDVHALIFSEDAVSLEKSLHQEFESRRVNQVNRRREFFFARPAEVREALQRFAGQHLLEFRDEPEAPEWRASSNAVDSDVVSSSDLPAQASQEEWTRRP